MPYKAKKPCPHHGCRELTNGGYCEAHNRAVNADYDRHHRDKEMKRFYNSQPWVRLRKAKLSRDPMCEACKMGGVLVIAAVVDHIVPVREGGARLDIDNLQSLCHSCHSRKTLRERTAKDYKF
jgi:5-methylcytosine-specific restriction protein A